MDELHTTVTEHAATTAERSRRIVVDVAESIVARRVPFVVRLLRQAGCEVKMVVTGSALGFVGAPVLVVVSDRPMSAGVSDDPTAVEYVAATEWAELVMIAPVSAGLLT